MEVREIAYVIHDGYLSHSGILGMKWGQKNGPPYPIKAGGHSAAEVKANPKLAKPAKVKTEGHKSFRKMSDDELKARIARSKLEDEYLKSQGKLTSQQKADIRYAVSSNIWSLLTKDIPKEGMGIVKELLGLRWFFWQKATLAALDSGFGKSVVDSGKSVLGMIGDAKKHQYKTEEASQAHVNKLEEAAKGIGDGKDKDKNTPPMAGKKAPNKRKRVRN